MKQLLNSLALSLKVLPYSSAIESFVMFEVTKEEILSSNVIPDTLLENTFYEMNLCTLIKEGGPYFTESSSVTSMGLMESMQLKCGHFSLRQWNVAGQFTMGRNIFAKGPLAFHRVGC